MEARKVETAKGRPGTPRRSDVAEAQRLFATVKQEPSNAFPLVRALKYCEEPDWNSWAAIQKFGDDHYAALVEMDNMLASAMAKARLNGI